MCFCVCVLFHDDDSSSYFLPGPRSMFWPSSALVPLFRTSPALSHFRLPPSSLMHCTHTHTHTHTNTHDISVTMATLSEAPRFSGEGVALSNPLLCRFKDETIRAECGRHCDCWTDAVCVFQSCTWVCLCCVRVVCVCVCHWPGTGMPDRM